ncbi:unnamed protein product [Vitrella brassicaformis CCMP3155]|uniref:C3H1-type domain-containing protein n=2 Tax=Vitrella brassicaformis TaxID=1169539 RepID=A0A0G4GZG5_VITBC|nr:unnamed protein product [Vitrella brassicaformis CCMP3155]|eukprot:CEM36602.1 unnamed protein product [Vitrella brassicaformis CCMP3155]
MEVSSGETSERSAALSPLIKRKLEELLPGVDADVLTEYVELFAAQKKDRGDFIEDLKEFLGDKTVDFVDWFLAHQQRVSAPPEAAPPPASQEESSRGRSRDDRRDDREDRDYDRYDSRDDDRYSRDRDRDRRDRRYRDERSRREYEYDRDRERRERDRYREGDYRRDRRVDERDRRPRPPSSIANEDLRNEIDRRAQERDKREAGGRARGGPFGNLILRAAQEAAVSAGGEAAAVPPGAAAAAPKTEHREGEEVHMQTSIEIVDDTPAPPGPTPIPSPAADQEQPAAAAGSAAADQQMGGAPPERPDRRRPREEPPHPEGGPAAGGPGPGVGGGPFMPQQPPHRVVVRVDPITGHRENAPPPFSAGRPPYSYEPPFAPAIPGPRGPPHPYGPFPSHQAMRGPPHFARRGGFGEGPFGPDRPPRFPFAPRPFSRGGRGLTLTPGPGAWQGPPGGGAGGGGGGPPQHNGMEEDTPIPPDQQQPQQQQQQQPDMGMGGMGEEPHMPLPPGQGPFSGQQEPGRPEGDVEMEGMQPTKKMRAVLRPNPSFQWPEDGMQIAPPPGVNEFGMPLGGPVGAFDGGGPIGAFDDGPPPPPEDPMAGLPKGLKQLAHLFPGKKLKRCRNWPDCPFGDQCKYVHPSSFCKMWPGCSFGKECLFIHPQVPCRFGIRCKNARCSYAHPPGWQPYGMLDTINKGDQYFNSLTPHWSKANRKALHKNLSLNRSQIDQLVIKQDEERQAAASQPGAEGDASGHHDCMHPHQEGEVHLGADGDVEMGVEGGSGHQNGWGMGYGDEHYGHGHGEEEDDEETTRRQLEELQQLEKAEAERDTSDHPHPHHPPGTSADTAAGGGGNTTSNPNASHSLTREEYLRVYGFQPSSAGATPRQFTQQGSIESQQSQQQQPGPAAAGGAGGGQTAA